MKPTVTIQDCDITTLQVDAIVNAANSHMRHGAGVAGAIRKAGGPPVCVRPYCGPTKVGHVHITSGGLMPCTYVIHAVTMPEPGGTCDGITAYNCTRNALRAADALGLRTVALPAFGAGIGGLPLRVCADFMLCAIDNFKAEALEEVTVAVFGDEARAAFIASQGNWA